MKITLHIPTEQYGFVSMEYESDGDIAYAEAAREYQLMADAFKPKPVNEMPAKEFNSFFDKMLLGEENHVEDLEKMSPVQRMAVNEVKKALKRLKAHEN